MMDLPALVAAQKRAGTIPAGPGVVAISGGPDSVALAHLLGGLLVEGQIPRLLLAHVNHQLRGADSDADEAFVLGLPAAWGADAARLTVRSLRIETARHAAETHDNLEATARAERYRWLAEVAQAEGAAWVAAGHTADDQAETVLFRLLRGSGLQGLGGMAPCRALAEGVVLIRPLLDVPRAEILRYLSERGLSAREDTSNRDERFTRNRLRHELLPMLRERYNPAVASVLCRLAEQARAVQSDLDLRAAELLNVAELPRAGAVLVFRAEALRAAPAYLAAEALRQAWRREGWPLDAMGYAEWRRLLDVAHGTPPAWDFPGRMRARRVGAVVQVGHADAPTFTGRHA